VLIVSILRPLKYSLLVYFFAYVSHDRSLYFRLVEAVVVGAAVCSRIPGLAKSQREQCRKAPHAMPAVGEGAALGLSECRHQFRHHRWNCSHVSNDQVFGHVVVVGKDCSVTGARYLLRRVIYYQCYIRTCTLFAPRKAFLPCKVVGGKMKLRS